MDNKCNKKGKRGKKAITRAIAGIAIVLLFAVIVFASGNPPYFTPVPPASFTCYQDSECFYDFNATDDEGDSINFSIDTPPFSQNINANTGKLNFTPTNEEVGDYNNTWVIVKEKDTGAGNFAIIDFHIININDPPNITAYYPTNQTNLTTREATIFEFNVTATDADLTYGDNLTYTWMVDGVVNSTLIIGINNTGNYTPDYLSAGIHTIRVNVTDSGNLTAWVNWTINVTNENRLCVQNDTIPNITITEDTQALNNFSLQDYFFDPDIDDYPLNFTVINNTDINITVNKSNNNSVTLDPDLNFFGTNVAQFQCFDGYNASNWSNEVTINVTNVQDQPNVTSEDNKLAYIGAFFSLQIQAIDYDDDVLTYYSNETTLFTIDASTGWINFTPIAGDLGNYSINITVGDGIDNTSIYFNLSVIDNSPPILGPIGDRSATEGTPFSMKINATDADVVEALNFSYVCNNCSGYPVNANIFAVTTINSSPTNATGTIGFTATNNDVGDWSVTYIVNDSRGATDTETIAFTIANVNFPPILDPIDDHVLKVNTSFELGVNATDADGDIIGFTDNTTIFDIANTTIGVNGTGTISFTPDSIGNHSVNITVRDSTGNLDWEQVWFNITRNRPPVIDPIADQAATEDFAFSVQVNATDPDPQDQGNLLYYDNTTLFDIGSSSGTISFTPNASQVGNYSVNITVSDGEYNDSTVMNITVLFYDDYPYWVPPLEQYYANGTNYLNTTPWNSTELNLVATNRTVWNASVWQNNRTIIYMDAYDEESSYLIFNVSFINFTNASNNTVITGITLFGITNYDNDTALLDFTPDNSDVGTYAVNLSIFDNTSRTTSTVIGDLVVHNVNDPPNITSFSPPVNQSMDENTTREFNITATDIDYGDSINYKWYLNDSVIGGVTDPNYTFYADFQSSGIKALRVSAIDTKNATTNHTWILNITNVNRPGWFGKIKYETYDELNAGNFDNTTVVQTGRYTSKVELDTLGISYRPSGIYESSIGDAKESNYFHNFTSINWTGNTSSNNSNVSFNVYFQTRTDQAENGGCGSSMSTNYSSAITVSGTNITSPQEPCIQYRMFMETNDTNHTPSVDSVELNYIIADYEQEQATNRNWIYLKDYFKDPDDDDELTYNVTNSDGTPIDPSQANFTISQSTSRVNMITNSDYEGEMLVKFHMTDGEYNVSSNTIKITITEIPPIETPIIIPVGGGGGGTVQQPIEVEVPEYIITPVSFRMLAPLKVSTYGNDTINIPINIINDGNFTLEDIDIKAETDNEYVTLTLSKSKIAALEPKKIDSLNLDVKSFRDYGDYEILLTATADAVTRLDTGQEIRTPLTEKTKIFIGSLLKAKGNDTAVQTKLAFAQDLLSSNPECLELNEFIEKARLLIEEGKENEANVLLAKIVESCKFLIAPRERLPKVESPQEVVRMPKESIYLLATVAFLTLLIAVGLIIGWAHMKKRAKDFQRKF